MKCELCQKADAETAIRRIIDGEEQELYVCRACAGHGAEPDKRQTEPAADPQAPLQADAEAMAALPLMGMILDAAFEIVGHATPAAEPTCPVCGITRAEYRKASRLGCPACYEAFAKEMEGTIFEMHRALQHVGKAPFKAHAVQSRQQLADALSEAIRDQRYEEAIALRDRLRKMDESAGCEGGGPV